MLALGLGAVAPAAAQQAVQPAATATVYSQPKGRALATLAQGADPATGATRNGWTEVTLTGWLPSEILRAQNRDGYDLVLSRSAGEDLRTAPDGPPVARIRNGVLLKKVAQRGGWTQVRRAGWMPAVKPADTRPADTKSAAKPVETKPAAKAADITRAAAVATGSGSGNGGERVEMAKAAPVYAVPDGGQLGTLQPGVAGQPVGRAGEWVRVQFEGWVRESDLKRAAGGALVGVSAAEVRAQPDKYVGQTVEWRVQFIAVQVADELRPELPAGQPYLLMRGPLPEPGFVYVAIPRDQVPRFRALQPLQELLVRGTIRAARTRYLPTPVLELVSARTPEEAAGR